MFTKKSYNWIANVSICVYFIEKSTIIIAINFFYEIQNFNYQTLQTLVKSDKCDKPVNCLSHYGQYGQFL